MVQKWDSQRTRPRLRNPAKHSAVLMAHLVLCADLLEYAGGNSYSSWRHRVSFVYQTKDLQVDQLMNTVVRFWTFVNAFRCLSTRCKLIDNKKRGVFTQSLMLSVGYYCITLPSVEALVFHSCRMYGKILFVAMEIARSLLSSLPMDALAVEQTVASFQRNRT